MNFKEPQNYHLITTYVESDRNSFEDVRKNRPDILKIQIALNDFSENCHFKNNYPNPGYIKALNFETQ